MHVTEQWTRLFWKVTCYSTVALVCLYVTADHGSTELQQRIWYKHASYICFVFLSYTSLLITCLLVLSHILSLSSPYLRCQYIGRISCTQCTDLTHSVVCTCVVHNHEICKNGWTFRDAVLLWATRTVWWWSISTVETGVFSEITLKFFHTLPASMSTGQPLTSASSQFPPTGCVAAMRPVARLFLMLADSNWQRFWLIFTFLYKLHSLIITLTFVECC